MMRLEHTLSLKKQLKLTESNNDALQLSSSSGKARRDNFFFPRQVRNIACHIFGVYFLLFLREKLPSIELDTENVWTGYFNADFQENKHGKHLFFFSKYVE